MSRRFRTPALLVASALLVVVAAAPVATAQTSGGGTALGGVGPHTWTVTANPIDVLSGPDRDLALTIDTDLWKPDDASAANPMPAILLQHGFGGHKANGELRTLAAFFASHGYVVVAVTAEGFGGSTGCISLNHQDYDVANNIQVIDWLAAQDYVATDAPGDPKIGLIGGSYGGGHQFRVAITDPRVDAIAPGRTWHTLLYSLVPNNLVDPAAPWDADHYEQGVFKQQWTSLFYSLGSTQPAMGNGGCDPITQQTLYPGTPPCTGFIPEVCEIYGRLVTTGESVQAGRDLVADAGVATVVDQLTTPTLIPQGLPDTIFNPNDAAATYVNLRSRGVPVAMLWISSGHGGWAPAPGDGEAYGGGFDDSPEKQAEFATTYFARRHLTWMEHHVRGNTAVDTGPGFAWFRDWVDYDIATTGGSSEPAYGTSTTFPPPTVDTVYALDPATSALVPAGTAFDGGDASFVNPPNGQPAAYTEVSNFSSPGQPGDRPPTEIAGQNVAFTTAPFDVDTEVVGFPTLTLDLSHQNTLTDAVLFAKLYDVAPDGSTTLIRRQVAPARIPTATLDAGPVTIRMIGVSHRFAAGHAARLVLASTDQAYFNNRQADQLTVRSSATAPSTLTLPTMPTPTPAPSPTPAPAPTTAPAQAAAPQLPATGGGAAAAGLLALVAGAAVWTSRRQEGN